MGARFFTGNTSSRLDLSDGCLCRLYQCLQYGGWRKWFGARRRGCRIVGVFHGIWPSCRRSAFVCLLHIFDFQCDFRVVFSRGHGQLWIGCSRGRLRPLRSGGWGFLDLVYGGTTFLPLYRLFDQYWTSTLAGPLTVCCGQRASAQSAA